MNRDAPLVIVGVVVALIAVVVLAAGAFGTTRTTTMSGPTRPLPYPADDGATGVIFDLHTEEGFSIFGIKFQADDHFAVVAVLVPPECVETEEAGSRTLLREGDCAGLPVHGEIAGEGTSPAGLQFLIVRTEVSASCFDALEIGDQWPPAVEDCSR